MIYFCWQRHTTADESQLHNLNAITHLPYIFSTQVDILSQNYDLCARVAGGSNAGHTIVVAGRTFKFHLLPSGMLNPSTVGVIGNGVVVHIPTLLKEIKVSEGFTVWVRVCVCVCVLVLGIFRIHDMLKGGGGGGQDCTTDFQSTLAYT